LEAGIERELTLQQLQLGSFRPHSGMVDELGLSELIDTVIKQDHEQRQVSVGQCAKAMILNGLGFVNRALYLMPHFFKDKPSNACW